MHREAIIIGGPNGAGKSTLANEYLQTYEFEYLSADIIAAALRPDQPEAARVQAGKRFFEHLDMLIRREQNLILEATLAGRGFGRVLARLRQAGYSTRIVFVFLDTPGGSMRATYKRTSPEGRSGRADSGYYSAFLSEQEQLLGRLQKTREPLVRFLQCRGEFSGGRRRRRRRLRSNGRAAFRVVLARHKVKEVWQKLEH